MTHSISLNDINVMSQAAFVDCLGGIFEHSPWVAETAHADRPFHGIDALHSSMTAAVQNAGRDAQLALMRAHPELAGKAAADGELTEASTTEQAGAGLDQCTAAELDEIRALNRAYLEKFDFPFIVAVKGRGKREIIALLGERLARSERVEFEEALEQIARIARLRLDALIAADSEN